jgi:hypothetical protein
VFVDDIARLSLDASQKLCEIASFKISYAATLFADYVVPMAFSNGRVSMASIL